MIFGLVFIILEAKEIPYCGLSKLKMLMKPLLEEVCFHELLTSRGDDWSC